MMGQVSVTMNGRTFRLRCGDGEEARLLKVSDHVRGHVDRLIAEHGQIGDERLLMMAAILITDELFEQRDLALRSAVPGTQVPVAQVPGAQVPGTQMPVVQVPGPQVTNMAPAAVVALPPAKSGVADQITPPPPPFAPSPLSARSAPAAHPLMRPDGPLAAGRGTAPVPPTQPAPSPRSAPAIRLPANAAAEQAPPDTQLPAPQFPPSHILPVVVPVRPLDKLDATALMRGIEQKSGRS